MGDPGSIGLLLLSDIWRQSLTKIGWVKPMNYYQYRLNLVQAIVSTPGTGRVNKGSSTVTYFNLYHFLLLCLRLKMETYLRHRHNCRNNLSHHPPHRRFTKRR